MVAAAAAGGVSLEPYSKMFCKLNLPHTQSINLYVVMSAVKLAGVKHLLVYREKNPAQWYLEPQATHTLSM